MASTSDASGRVVLSSGDNPQWARQAASAARPSSLTDGLPINSNSSVVADGGVGALRTHIVIQPRIQDAASRTSDVTITFDAATTYNIIINGTTVATPGNASLGQTLVDMADDIATDGTVGSGAGAAQVVTATALDEDGLATTTPADAVSVRITSSNPSSTVLNEADYGLEVSVSGGSGTIAATADAVRVGCALWGLPGNGPNTNPSAGPTDDSASPRTPTAPQTWLRLEDLGEVDNTGAKVETAGYCSAGYTRVYVQQISSLGHPQDGATTSLQCGYYVGPSAKPTT